MGSTQNNEHSPMEEGKSAVSSENLDQCRSYLMLLAKTGLNQRLRAKLDPSDIVQQSLLQAHSARNSFRGKTKNELMAWLKQILTRNLMNAARHYGREKRDVGRELSLEQTLQFSWLKVDQVLAQSGGFPDDEIQAHEERLLMCAVVEQLPDAQRTAVELHHFLGWPISKVAEEMGRTPVAVSGLLKRGLKTLRAQLKTGADSSR